MKKPDPRRRRGVDGQQVQREAEDEDQDDRRDELGDRGQREPGQRDHAVGDAAAPQRREDAADDAERHDEGERDARRASSEFSSAGPSSEETDTWYSSDFPRLPWTKFEIQSPYCV